MRNLPFLRGVRRGGGYAAIEHVLNKFGFALYFMDVIRHYGYFGVIK